MSRNRTAEQEDRLNALSTEDRETFESQSKIYNALDEAANGATHSAMVRAVASYVVDQAFFGCDSDAVSDKIVAARDLVKALTEEAYDYCQFKMKAAIKRMSGPDTIDEIVRTLKSMAKYRDGSVAPEGL